MLTYTILFINILYYKISFIHIYIYTYTSRALINESILIRAGSRVLIESSRVYTSLHRLIIEFDFVFTSSSFNNRFEYESSLSEPISSKLTSSSARLHPY
jgi:tRNA C32,U32 (ribose-2'-O)-methylase TrmJ